MPAAVASATVEPSATAAMEAIASVEATAVATTAVPAVVTIATMTVKAAVTIVAATAIVSASIIATTVEAATVVAVEPGARADEDAADEVVRSVVAVWSAGVRIVAVITIGADRRWSDDGTYPYSQANLRVSAARCGKKQNSQQSNIF